MGAEKTWANVSNSEELRAVRQVTGLQRETKFAHLEKGERPSRSRLDTPLYVVVSGNPIKDGLDAVEQFLVPTLEIISQGVEA